MPRAENIKSRRKDKKESNIVADRIEISLYDLLLYKGRTRKLIINRCLEKDRKECISTILQFLWRETLFGCVMKKEKIQ